MKKKSIIIAAILVVLVIAIGLLVTSDGFKQGFKEGAESSQSK